MTFLYDASKDVLKNAQSSHKVVHKNVVNAFQMHYIYLIAYPLEVRGADKELMIYGKNDT